MISGNRGPGRAVPGGHR